ncbi:RRQRL motif-containing zinc-binding protein [Umezawaea sp. NPDC059074]|uniref:RRQRL motif-containing zinc-binding protein n=1 Tax=Umezawaea sp. NPDC059074 TaxID=3346716 RepID=UPI00369AAD3E
MAGKAFGWVWTPSVPWQTGPTYTRGTHDGLPLLSHGMAPRHLLATYRQLRSLNLRPGGADPVAVLYGRHNKSGKTWFASLYLIAAAVPVRPMTPAKWTAIAKANLGRRICPECGHDRGYIVPRWDGRKCCVPCFDTACDTDLKEAA